MVIAGQQTQFNMSISQHEVLLQTVHADVLTAPLSCTCGLWWQQGQAALPGKLATSSKLFLCRPLYTVVNVHGGALQQYNVIVNDSALQQYNVIVHDSALQLYNACTSCPL